MRDPLRCEESPEEACHESYQICFPTFDQTDSLAGGNSYIFFMFTPILGEDSQFDEHIFQWGWFNHQPETDSLFFGMFVYPVIFWGSDERTPGIGCIFRILNEERFIQNIRIFFESQGGCCHCIFFPGEWYIYMT